jgi:hypothetical protein
MTATLVAALLLVGAVIGIAFLAAWLAWDREAS